MLKEFREFLLRGNIVELAVAVVMGVAFQSVVDSLVTDLITPLIGAIFGKPDFSGLTFTINDSIFSYGNFINSVISFLMTAVAIFFFVVKPMNMATARMEKKGEATTRECPECLSEVPIAATRCKFCGQPLRPGLGS